MSLEKTILFIEARKVFSWGVPEWSEAATLRQSFLPLHPLIQSYPRAASGAIRSANLELTDRDWIS